MGGGDISVGELELVAPPEVARVALKLLMLREELARLVVAEAEQHAPWTPAACHRRSEHKHRRLHTETVVTLKPLCPCSLPSKIARWSIQLEASSDLLLDPGRAGLQATCPLSPGLGRWVKRRPTRTKAPSKPTKSFGVPACSLSASKASTAAVPGVLGPQLFGPHGWAS